MKDYKILFADLDGTLIKTKSGETFPKGIWDMEFRFEVLDRIKELDPYYIFIVPSQACTEFGSITKLDYISKAITEYCECSCYYDFCGTNNESDPCRKPNIGMLENLFSDHIDMEGAKSKSLMIGDASGKEGQWSDTDKKTAENFGIDYMDVEDFVKCKFE